MLRSVLVNGTEVPMDCARGSRGLRNGSARSQGPDTKIMRVVFIAIFGIFRN